MAKSRRKPKDVPEEVLKEPKKYVELMEASSHWLWAEADPFRSRKYIQ